MIKIIAIVSIAAAIIVIIIFALFIYFRSKKKDFDLTPRDRNGEELDQDEDIENDPSQAPVYEDDVTYDDWESWEEFLQEIGLVDIKNGMIEYETADNSRMFVMLAEMQQSNPYLKTDDELEQQNAVMELFYNTFIKNPVKITSQSQKVEMTDYLNQLSENAHHIPGVTKEMQRYAEQVIDDTRQYQRETERFENRAYVQFMTTITPDEVYGESTETLEEQIHEKAFEKLMRQIERASGLLRRADHALAPLDNFGLLEVLYKTFNRQSSVKIRFEDIIKKQRYALWVTSPQSDKTFKEIQQKIHIEAEALRKARDELYRKQDQINKDRLANNEDFYSASDAAESYDSSDYDEPADGQNSSGTSSSDGYIDLNQFS